MCCVMGAMAAGGAILGFTGSRDAARAQRASGEYQGAVLEQNAALDERRAAETRTLGHAAEEDLLRKARVFAGGQRAAIAASGVQSGTGSALQLEVDTARQASMDATRLRANVLREAWGFEVEAWNKRQDAQNVRMGGQALSRSTMLTGYSNLLSSAGSIYSSYGRG